MVKQRFDLGAVSKTDYLKATVRYGSAKSTLLTRELSFNNSFKNLRNSMGLIGTDTKISLPKKVEINLIIPSFDEAYQLMLTNSPSLNILDRRVTSAKIGVKQSWASSLPSLSMSLGYNATSSDQLTKLYFEDNYIKSANLTLSILFLMVSEKGTTLKFLNYSYLKVKLHSVLPKKMLRLNFTLH